MYDQRSTKDTPSEVEDDWIFRRERIGLLDTSLRNNKADILFIQQGQQVPGSPVDADDAILRAGALSGYDIEKRPYNDQDPDDDQDIFVTAVTAPFRITSASYATSHIELGVDAMISVADVEGLPIILINADSSYAKPDVRKDFYKILADALTKVLELKKTCANRIIIAGTLPEITDGYSMEQFLSQFNLVEVVSDQCKEKDACVTYTHENVLYKALIGKPRVHERIDRILVHQDTDIDQSTIAFNQVFPASEYAAKEGLPNLSISTHYGWSGEFKFARCKISE
jgi:hypothetical protein